MEPKRKPMEKARDPATYRSWKRNNAVKWQGVRPEAKVEHPPLTKKVSKKGEVYYEPMAEV